MSKPDAMTFGFRILGSVANDRRLIDWPAAFVAHAECEPKQAANPICRRFVSEMIFANT
jgi:hypothetical protein